MNATIFSILSFLLLLLCFTRVQSAVTVTLGVTVVNPPLPSLKENFTDVWNIMYVGLYSLQDLKVQAMKFAVQHINNRMDILPNTKLNLYGCNSGGDRGSTTSAVLAGYAAYEVQAFIGAESFADTQALQYISAAYWMPQMNPTVVEQSLSNRNEYRSLINIIPPSSDQQIAALAVLQRLGINKVLLITTNDVYGNEFSNMAFNVEAIRLNITFYQITIETTGSDNVQKLNLIKEKMPFYRYVLMHCSTNPGLRFLKILGDNDLIGPDYLYIITHQMSLAVQEKASFSAPYIKYLNGAIGISARYNSESEFANGVRSSFASASRTTFPAAGTDIKSAWFAFDAVYAYALALHDMLESGLTTTTITGEAYYNKLLESNFNGVTGNVTVNATAARRHGLWDIVNFVPFEVTNTSNGTVTPTFIAVANGQSTNLESVNGDFVFFAGRTTVPDPYIEPPTALRIREYNRYLSAALGAIVGLAVLVTVFSSIMLLLYWGAFARHGSFYSAVILAGIYITYISTLVILPEPTDSLCTAFPWFLGIGFTFVYGCLFIKTWTLYRVWLDAEKFKKTQLTPMTIMKGISVAVLLEIVFLVVWTIIDPPRAKLHKMVGGEYMLQCQTENITFWAIFIAIKGAWLIFGAVLSVVTRRIMREFNHSTSIAYAIYNIFALLVLAVPLAMTLEDIPSGRLIIQVAVIVIAFTFTTVCLFFNVWYRIFVPVDEGINSIRGTHSTHSHSGGPSYSKNSQNSQFSKNSKNSHSNSNSQSHSTSLSHISNSNSKNEEGESSNSNSKSNEESASVV